MARSYFTEPTNSCLKNQQPAALQDDQMINLFAFCLKNIFHFPSSL